ncbi:MAG: hypothetical protein K2I86_08690 [Prevotella sp.]|nr:hypothetical protein [Prevotella sp.]
MSEEVLKNFHTEKEYLDDTLQINIQWGGREAFRSIVKTALDYYLYKGHDRIHILHLINYLLGKDDLDIVKMYYPDTCPYQVSDNQVLNLIHIVGDKEESTLFAYVIYLGCFPSVILLSDHYAGNSFVDTYAHDVMSHQEVSISVNLEMTLQKFNAYQPYKNNFFQNATSLFNHVVKVGVEKQGSDEVHDIVERSFSSLQEGELILEPEKIKSQLLTNLGKYLKHCLHLKDDEES